jgi:wyosine [tRNA(Phe)-imidazoG37] synthetase (radical SAM superfamily)
MGTFLFNEIIFGPVQSRRLGTSLGINLLPLDSKLCNFNCLYCECGLSDDVRVEKGYIFSSQQIISELEKSLKSFQNSGKIIDTITFAGNGEPTLHPEFSSIIEDTVLLRNKWYPRTKIAVLSNATLIGRPDIREALKMVDYNILKLDSAFEETIRRINCPAQNFSIQKLFSDLKLFTDNLTIQTLFLRGNYNGFYFDNSSDSEVEELLKIYKELNPKLVMIYTIARETPIKSLEKIAVARLKEIAVHIENIGLPVQISA